MKENPCEAPKSIDRVAPGNTVTVEISGVWVRRLNSPLFVVVDALTGVSISFAPMGLLWLGIRNQWKMLTVSGAVVCFLTVYFVPVFYMRLAGQVIRQLVSKKRCPEIRAPAILWQKSEPQRSFCSSGPGQHIVLLIFVMMSCCVSSTTTCSWLCGVDILLSCGVFL